MKEYEISKLKALYPQATQDGLDKLLTTATATKLDPFQRQIYLTYRWDGRQKREVPIVVTGIDGYRAIAERAGDYRGQVGPQWCGKDGKWVDVWLGDGPPAAARVGVLRSKFTEPVWGVATYRAYCQRKKDGRPTDLWARMPDVMLAKCAEANALRRAFPSQFSGMYVEDEIDGGKPAPSHAVRRSEAIRKARELIDAQQHAKPQEDEPERPSEPRGEDCASDAGYMMPNGARSAAEELVEAISESVDTTTAPTVWDVAERVWPAGRRRGTKMGAMSDRMLAAAEKHLTTHGSEYAPELLEYMHRLIAVERDRRAAERAGEETDAQT